MGNILGDVGTQNDVLERVYSKQKLGGYYSYIPPMQRSLVITAIREAEAEKGAPVYMPDIRRALNTHYHLLGPSTVFLRVTLNDLYRNDEVLSCPECDRFTLKKENQCTKDNVTKYELFSDRFARMFPGYINSPTSLVEPGPDTNVVNFEYLKELLLSKDLSRLVELEEISKEKRFLDDKVDMTQGDRVAFCSFPRSGNSFLRKYLEEITGICTGSDTYVEISHSLQTMGLKGESHANTDKVWITKTHHPWTIILSTKFVGNKMIFLMRNPIDNIPSLAHLSELHSHSLVTKEDYSKDFPEFWELFTTNAIKDMKEYFRVMTENAIKNVPTYAMRFEDLRNEPEKVLSELLSFILDVPSIEGTVVQL